MSYILQGSSAADSSLHTYLTYCSMTLRLAALSWKLDCHYIPTFSDFLAYATLSSVAGGLHCGFIIYVHSYVEPHNWDFVFCYKCQPRFTMHRYEQGPTGTGMFYALICQRIHDLGLKIFSFNLSLFKLSLSSYGTSIYRLNDIRLYINSRPPFIDTIANGSSVPKRTWLISITARWKESECDALIHAEEQIQCTMREETHKSEDIDDKSQDLWT